MPGRLGEEPRAVVLPSLDMHAGIAPPHAGDPRPGVGVARQAGAQVVDGEVDGLGHRREASGLNRGSCRAAAFHPLPYHLPGEFHDRGDLEDRAGGAAMQGRQCRVADQLLVEGKLGGQLIAATVKNDAEVADVGDARDHAGEGRVAPLLQHLDGFGRGAARGHDVGRSTGKAPCAAATGSSGVSV